MAKKLPPTPQVGPVVRRTLYAATIAGAVACGGPGYTPSRIGPPPPYEENIRIGAEEEPVRYEEDIRIGAEEEPPVEEEEDIRIGPPVDEEEDIRIGPPEEPIMKKPIRIGPPRRPR